MQYGNKKVHLHPKHNTAGFHINPQNINKEGRPKGSTGIISTTKKLAKGKGWVRKSAEYVKKVRNEPWYDVKLTDVEFLFNKLQEIASESEDHNIIRASQLLLSYLVGQPKQSIELEQKQEIKKLPFHVLAPPVCPHCHTAIELEDVDKIKETH